jgi:hypothetical protein
VPVVEWIGLVSYGQLTRCNLPLSWLERIRLFFAVIIAARVASRFMDKKIDESTNNLRVLWAPSGWFPFSV